MPLLAKLYLDDELIDWYLYFDRKIADEEAEKKRKEGFRTEIYREGSDQYLLFWFNK